MTSLPAQILGLRDRGHELHLLCPEEARIYGEAQAQGLPVTALPIARKNLRGLSAMRRWLARHPADVLNCHSSTDSWLATLACVGLAGAPALVRTRHVSAPISSNGPTRWLYCSAQRIVTTGELLRQDVLAAVQLPPDRVVSIPTGIDSDRFQPMAAAGRAATRARLGLPTTGTLVGIVATLRSWKGHADLVDALARLPGDIHLAIVGDGPQRERLQEQIAALNLTDRVTMPGNQDDVLPWLQAFDIFVLPSYANEGVPQALVQALLTGLAAVTTDIGAIPEVAHDGETALVVPPRDVAALAAAIERLAGDAKLREKLGSAARKHCAANFDRRIMLDRMEEVFRDVAAQRAA